MLLYIDQGTVCVTQSRESLPLLQNYSDIKGLCAYLVNVICIGEAAKNATEVPGELIISVSSFASY